MHNEIQDAPLIGDALEYRLHFARHAHIGDRLRHWIAN
jgi:hypothetical protein